VVSQAEGDAERFRSVLTEYQKAPGVTRDRLYIDTMQQVYSNVTKVMVDAKQGSNMLYLPLDKIMQLNAASSAAPNPAAPAAVPAAVDAPAAAPATSAATPDARSRDGLRSRDRDSR
jgi:membrane protease subunit HflK